MYKLIVIIIESDVIKDAPSFSKFTDLAPISRKTVIVAAIAITAVVTIDYLGSRQIFPYDNFLGAIIFGSNIIVVAVGSFIILKYVSQVSAEVRARSLLFDRIFKVVIAVMLVLLVTFVAMFIGSYYYNVSVRYLAYFVFSLSAIVSVSIMIIIGFKFFSWYKVSRGRDRDRDTHRLLLVCGLAAASLGAAMAFDAGAKMLLVRVVEEESPPGSIPQDVYIYKYDEKYQGDVQYKVVKPDTTTVYILPSSMKLTWTYLNGWIPITVGYVFTWAIITMLLRQFYNQRVGKMPVTLLILLTIPLALYMIGRYTEMYTLFSSIIGSWNPQAPINLQYGFQNVDLFRIIFRAGVISGSIMYGVAFLVVARKIESGKIKDYFTFAAIGAMMISITLGPSGLQETFGVAGRTLFLLASFMLCAGFYLSAVHMAQDARLRRVLKASAGSEVFGDMAAAQLEQETEKRVLDIVEKERESIKEQTGIQPSLEQKDVKTYLDSVLQELQSKKENNQTTKGDLMPS
jgi:hypothetical protein